MYKELFSKLIDDINLNNFNEKEPLTIEFCNNGRGTNCDRREDVGYSEPIFNFDITNKNKIKSIFEILKKNVTLHCSPQSLFTYNNIDYTTCFIECCENNIFDKVIDDIKDVILENSDIVFNFDKNIIQTIDISFPLYYIEPKKMKANNYVE